MSLRDYFAGQALTGCMALFVEAAKAGMERPSEMVESFVSNMAYSIADAMLAERVKP